MRTVLVFGLLFACAFPAAAVELRATEVAAGLDKPILAVSPPADYERLFIIEQYTAQIRILKNGQLMAQPFLDINPLVANSGFERGLLGLAFHPDYASNGFFFVHYSGNDGGTVVARYTVTGNPDIADAASAKTVYTRDQPFQNHNGGMISFGPDGYLYIALGDGGGGGDPLDAGQDLATHLGKILRIDVDTSNPYAVPPDNPFVQQFGVLPEIWTYGWRNPWRFSFDRATGDMYVGDVGQSAREEISFQPASSTGGENYGWNTMEGSLCFPPGSNCDQTGLVLPIHEYQTGSDCSITGGYVYRGCAIPQLDGHYFFADWCSGKVWSFKYENGLKTEFTDRTAELNAGISGSIGQVSSFGQDGLGEIYIVDHGNGKLYRIDAETGVGADCNANGIEDACDIAKGTSQDANGNLIPDECESTPTPAVTSTPSPTPMVEPTATPAPTITPTPTIVPTATPVPAPMGIGLGGYMGTDVDSASGGQLQLLVLANSSEGVVESCRFWFNGQPQPYSVPLGADADTYFLELSLPPGAASGSILYGYALERADGTFSEPWPYLHVGR